MSCYQTIWAAVCCNMFANCFAIMDQLKHFIVNGAIYFTILIWQFIIWWYCWANWTTGKWELWSSQTQREIDIFCTSYIAILCYIAIYWYIGVPLKQSLDIFWHIMETLKHGDEDIWNILYSGYPCYSFNKDRLG